MRIGRCDRGVFDAFYHTRIVTVIPAGGLTQNVKDFLAASVAPPPDIAKPE